MRGSNMKKSFTRYQRRHGSPSSMSLQMGACSCSLQMGACSCSLKPINNDNEEENQVVKGRWVGNRDQKERAYISTHYPTPPSSQSPTPPLRWSGPTTFTGRGRATWGGIYGYPRPNEYPRITGRGRVAWTSRASLRPANEEARSFSSGCWVANRGRRERTPVLHDPTPPDSLCPSQPSLCWSGHTTPDDTNTSIDSSSEVEFCGKLALFATTTETDSSKNLPTVSSNDYVEENERAHVITSRAYFAKGYGHRMLP